MLWLLRDGRRLDDDVDFLRTRQNVFVDLFGLLVLLLLQVGGGEIVLRLGDIRIIDAESFRIDFNRSFIVVFHFIEFALILAEKSEVVQLFGNVGMCRAETLLAYIQRTLAQSFGFSEFTSFACRVKIDVMFLQGSRTEIVP